LSRLTIVPLLLAALCLAARPASADRASAQALLAQVRPLLDAGKYDEARSLLNQAVAADPQFPDVWANLGYLDELQTNYDAALAEYGRALSLFPDLIYAQQRFRGLFYGHAFPRTIPLDQLNLVPVALTADEARAVSGLPTDPGVRTERIAYTTGILYPDQMRTTGASSALGAPLTLPLPGVGEAGTTVSFNRVCYGYTAASVPDRPGASQLVMRVAVYYPSSTISSGDYSALAVRLTHWLTRVQAYYDLHLGWTPATQPAAYYLCEPGPNGIAGAETIDNSVYFYKITDDHAALEWMREGAHETGHLLLPKIGRFTAPEAWASGFVGERLGLQWLAQEAGLVAGAPWPDPAAQDKLRGLWAGAPLPLADYLDKRCRPLLDSWAQAGPAAPQLADDGEAGFWYAVGFVMWVQAAHDDAILAATLKNAGGTNAADYLKSYQEAVRARLAGKSAYLPLWSGALTLPDSKLLTPPAESALRRAPVTLAPGDQATYHLFLPAGAFQITALAPPGALLSATLDAQPLSARTDKRTTFSFTAPDPGWHTLTLTPGGKEAVEVDYLRVEASQET
jgi:hypothetical protein